MLAIGERLGGQGAEDVLDGRAAEGKWWIASRSQSTRPSSTAAIVVTVPARPTNVFASVSPGISRAMSSIQASVTEMQAWSSSGAGGSRLDVLLGEVGRSRCRSRRRRLDVGGPDDELGGAAADVDHEERAVGRVELGGGAAERELGLLLAREQLGADADDRPRPRRRTRRGSRRRERPRWRSSGRGRRRARR